MDMVRKNPDQAEAVSGSGRPGATGKRARANQLQFLRFLAFCLVFIWHADRWSFPGLFSGGYGAAGAVACFFMLGGFVTGYSHFDDECAVTLRGIGAYVWRKLRKVYPLYIFTMLFAVLFTRIPKYIAMHQFEYLKKPLIRLLRNALLIQSWFPKGYFSFNGVGWFMSTMMFLYLLTLPMLALATRIRRTKRPVLAYCASVIALSAAAVLYCYILRNTEMEYTQYVLPVARVWEYAAGICLGCLTRCVKPRLGEPRLARTLTFTAAEAAVFALWIAAPYKMDYPAWQFRIVHWLLPDILLLLTFGLGEGLLSAAFRARPLVALGDLTFECFLLHQLVITVYGKFNDYKQASPLGNAFMLAFCMLLTLMLSRLIHGTGRPAQRE